MFGKNISDETSLFRSIDFRKSVKSIQKSLGQNFLIDNNIINKIVSIINIKGKEVLEVGPGTESNKKIIEKKPQKYLA